jgi:ribonuclease P/MRP protein subunit POP1
VITRGQVQGPNGRSLVFVNKITADVDPNRYLEGSRVLDTHIYKPGSYPFDLIAPITIVWKPNPAAPCPGSEKDSQEPVDVLQEPTQTEVLAPPEKKLKPRSGKEKEKEPFPDSEPPRIVWIRSHPAVFEDVFASLQKAASLTVEAFEKSKDKEVEIKLSDLRGQVNVFEIMGPKSSQVIKGAMTPVKDNKGEYFKKVCHMFKLVFAANIFSSGPP